MSGWLWVLLGVGAWMVLATVLALTVGAAVRAADRRERRRRSAGEDLEPPDADRG
ncbi:MULTISPECIES: hypothetical protein [unclassified Blastococcus]